MPLTRSPVFSRVSLDFLVRGAVTVRWDIGRRFWDPQPYVFQVQARREGDQAWQNAGNSTQASQTTIGYTGSTGWVTIPLVNAPKTILRGTDRRVEFRVVLTTPLGEYESPVARPLGEMPKRMWTVAREIIRRSQTAVKQKGLTSFRGYLFRHKMFGEACSTCVDTSTGECMDSACPHCNGTGIVKGYWSALDVPMIELSGHTEERDVVEERGTVDGNRVHQGIFVGPVFPENRDVWVEYGSDRRYAIGPTKVVSHFNGVPLVSEVTLRELEHDDPVYDLPIA